MHLDTKKILPVLLSVSLPGIGFFFSEMEDISSTPFIYKWLYTSFVLYSLWYILRITWKFNSAQKQFAYLVTCLFLFLVVVRLISYSTGIRDNLNFELNEFIRVAFLILIFISIQFGLESQKKIDHLKIEKEQLSKENYKARLQSLSKQIDPHFLFNSLNTLRSMVRQNHSKSEEFILNLSDFYRSTLQYSEEATLAITEELTLLNSYLQLMKSRNEEAVNFKIATIEKSFSNFVLPSFALQNVVENCFKHNSMSSKKPLYIQIVSTTDGFIEVSNTIQEKISQEPTSGMGLKLIERRYALLGVAKGITVSSQKGVFKVRLKLINSENERINS